MSGQRLKLRHKVTGEEKGPFFQWPGLNWFRLFATGEYDYIRSSDVFDKNGHEIFAGDLISIADVSPIAVIEKLDQVGIMTCDGFRELTEDWSTLYEIVGRDGGLPRRLLN